jgi:hypothetical protein
MTSLDYICTVCNKARFPIDKFEEAEEHSKIIVNEGSYNGMILKDSSDNLFKQYILLTKTPFLSENHQREYLPWRFSCFNLNSYLDIFGGFKPDKLSILAVEDIDKIIKDKKWIGLNKKEFHDLVEKMEIKNPLRLYSLEKIKEFTTLND